MLLYDELTLEELMFLRELVPGMTPGTNWRLSSDMMTTEQSWYLGQIMGFDLHNYKIFEEDYVFGAEVKYVTKSLPKEFRQLFKDGEYMDPRVHGKLIKERLKEYLCYCMKT